MSPEEYAKARKKLVEMKLEAYVKKHPVKSGLIGAGILATPLAVGYTYNRLSGHPAYGHDKAAMHQKDFNMSNKYLVKIAQMQKAAADREDKSYSFGYGAGGLMAGSLGGAVAGIPAALTGRHMLNNVSDTVSADTVRKYADSHDMSGVEVHGYNDRLTSKLPERMVATKGGFDLGSFDDVAAGPHHNPYTGRTSAGSPASIHTPDSGTVLLHEMSHADFHNKLKGKGMLFPHLVGRKVGPGLGGTIGGAMIGSDEGSKYAAGINALGYVPTLVDEGQANARAYAHIRKYQPDAIAKGGVRKAVLGSMLSYTAPMVGSSGALYGMHRLRHSTDES